MARISPVRVIGVLSRAVDDETGRRTGSSRP
jgi:hypothetical protein